MESSPGMELLWIGDSFDGREIKFPIKFPKKNVWKLEDKLSESSQQVVPPSEAKAVYVCKQISGRGVGSQAIIKVRMQYVFPLAEPFGQ
jgi:hypothetical protein